MFVHKEKDVDDIIAHMVDNGFSLDVDDDAAGFWGIELGHQEDSTIELKQWALIQCIINDIGFQLANGKATPADVAELPVNVNVPRLQEIWSYSSVVGMIMYLSGTTRPEIAIAVHQCAQYSHNP
eukprot:15339877-Ditylum_brightwellii.AAC.1